MKCLVRLTIPIVTLGALVLGAWVLPAWGQGANPPASTQASGQTSGRGETGVEQTVQGSEASTAKELIGLENHWAEEAKKGKCGRRSSLVVGRFRIHRHRGVRA